MKFIESFDGQQSPPPYFFPDVSINGCLLNATSDNLQTWCDTYLNIGNFHFFKPLVPLVYVCVSHYPKMVSVGMEDFGFSTQDEYFCMFPLVRFVKFGFILIPVELSWAFPFIGVTNGTSAISGQMVLGYPKSVGEITRATAPDGSFEAVVKMPGFRRFTPDSRQEQLNIVTLRTGAPAATGASPAARFPWSLATDGRDGGFDDVLIELLSELVPGLSSVTMLKQIRDGERPTEACFQTLMQADWELAHSESTVELADGTVDIFDNASVRIVETLGLTDGADIPPPTGAQPGGTPLPQGRQFKAIASFALQTDIRFGQVNDIGL